MKVGLSIWNSTHFWSEEPLTQRSSHTSYKEVQFAGGFVQVTKHVASSQFRCLFADSHSICNQGMNFKDTSWGSRLLLFSSQHKWQVTSSILSLPHVVPLIQKWISFFRPVSSNFPCANPSTLPRGLVSLPLSCIFTVLHESSLLKRK